MGPYTPSVNPANPQDDPARELPEDGGPRRSTPRDRWAELDALPPLNDPERGVRLQRFLADAGVASRRHSELLITEGRVEVNGTPVIELPIFVNPELDRVTVDNKPIAGPERHVYIMLNKPARFLSTVMDEPGADRKTVLDLVDHPSGARLFPVGRLDYETTGLMLMTNDGDLANKLTHPRYGIHKTYRVTVKGLLEDEDIAKLEEGIYLAERRAGRTVGAVRTSRVELVLVRRDRERTILEMTLREGRNRQVRRMLAGVGCPVKKLERIAMGPIRLKGLARGEWRELERHELRNLRKAADGDKRALTLANAQTAGQRRRKAPSRSETPAERSARERHTRRNRRGRG